MSATSIDLSQIKTDALSAASTFRTLIGLGTLATQSPTGTANSTTYLRGDFTWQTVSAGASWGSITGTLSSQTDLQSALDAKASLSGATFTGRITTPSILLSGNYSSTAWTTSGVGLSHTARTLTDTSSTGTVATAYTNVLGGNTIAASNATTFTDYASLFIGSPTAGSNVTITNAFSLITQGAARFGGQLSIPTAAVLANSFCPGNIVNRGFFYDSSFLNVIYIGLNGTARFAFDWGNLRLGATNAYGTSSGITWCSGDPLSTSVDLALVRDAANILAQRNSTNAQTFRIYNTYTDATNNFERGKIGWSGGVFQIGTEKGLTSGAARALELQTDGTTRLTIASTGAVTATGRITALDFLTTSDGRGFQVWQSAGGPAAIQFGMSVPGTGSGSDMWFSTTSNLNTWIGRLSISSSTGTATFYGDVQIADAKNIVINTTTGTKIGTATTQKLGFFNSTPVVQPAAVADATDAASVITQLNLLLARMRDLGLIAT